MSAWSELGPQGPTRMEVCLKATELMRLASLARELSAAGPTCDLPRALRVLDHARELLSPANPAD